VANQCSHEYGCQVNLRTCGVKLYKSGTVAWLYVSVYAYTAYFCEVLVR
jgi:hypothetical protein